MRIAEPVPFNPDPLVTASPQHGSLGPLGKPGISTPAQTTDPRWSIRTKGWLVVAALMIYLVTVSSFVLLQKSALLRDFEEIQRALETEATLKEVDVSAFHAVMALFVNIDSNDHTAGLERIRTHLQSLESRRESLKQLLPDVSFDLNDLNATWEAANRDPSKTNLNRLMIEMIKDKDYLSAMTEQIQANRNAMAANFRQQTSNVLAITFGLGIVGLTLLGITMAVFFRRLTKDLRLLQNRALAIVEGFRGAPIEVRRHDEVGQLMHTVNQMSDILDRREKELTLERQKHFHQEKMAAIGALAAGVSHEIGNPIAAIAGIAQDMLDRKQSNANRCAAGDCGQCQPDLIVVQTKRLAAITREISEFGSPRAATLEWLDLNANLRSAASLIRYDTRLKRIQMTLQLDDQLPAIHGIADQLTQVIMNLLINAMDALETVQDRQPEIVVTTSCDGAQACLQIADNGEGIAELNLSRIFEAFFTTKPAGKGTGLGLSLCYSIIRNHGGSIDLTSTPKVGTTVRVLLPLHENAYSEGNFQ